MQAKTLKSWHEIFKWFQIPSECTIYDPCFHVFCSFKSHHNACLRDMFFKITAVPDCLRYSQNAFFRDIVFIFLCISKSFQIPSDYMLKRHAFLNFLCNTRSFQILTIIIHAWESLFSKINSAFPNLLKYRQNVMLGRHCFPKKIWSSKSFRIVSKCML